MVTGELHNVIDEYNTITQEKKVWQILLEASQIEVDLLTEELEEVKMQFNSFRKSPSYSSVQSNLTTFYRKKFQIIARYENAFLLYNQVFGVDRSSRFRRFPSNSDISTKSIYYTCGDMGHESFNCRKFSYGKCIQRPKVDNNEGPKNNWEEN